MLAHGLLSTRLTATRYHTRGLSEFNASTGITSPRLAEIEPPANPVPSVDEEQRIRQAVYQEWRHAQAEAEWVSGEPEAVAGLGNYQVTETPKSVAIRDNMLAASRRRESLERPMVRSNRQSDVEWLELAPHNRRGLLYSST